MDINHLEGYWGTVSGADFCEYNYNVTTYVGEICSTFTALLNFVVLGVAYSYAAKVLFPEGFPLVMEMMLLTRGVNLLCATCQHATLNSIASNAQEATLAVGIWFMVFVFFKWGHRNELPAYAVLVWGAAVGGLQMFTVFDIALPFGLSNLPLSPIVSILALTYVSFVARSTSTRFLMFSAWTFVCAEFFFTLTAVPTGLCPYLHGYQLHSLGHIFGCMAEWCNAMWLFAIKLESDGVLVKISRDRLYIPYVAIQYDDANSEDKVTTPLIAQGTYSTFDNI